MAEIRPEDEINGFKLTDKAVPLFVYALHLKTLNFELPLSWWQDHIVPNADDVLMRNMVVEGPVVLAHDVCVFDGWKTVCRNSMAYADAAFAGLMDIFSRFQMILDMSSEMVGDFEYDFNREAIQQQLTSSALLFLEEARLLTVVRNRTLNSKQIGLAPLPRSWCYRKYNIPTCLSFAQWQNTYCLPRSLPNMTQRQIEHCVSHYLSVNFPQKFGGGK